MMRSTCILGVKHAYPDFGNHHISLIKRRWAVGTPINLGAKTQTPDPQPATRFKGLGLGSVQAPIYL